MGNPSLPEPYHRTILEAAVLSARHGELVSALEIEEALLARLSSSPLQEEVRTAIQQTSKKIISQLTKEKDAMKVIKIYHRHPGIFRSTKSTHAARLKIAISHNRMGLYSEAVKLLTPIVEHNNKLLGEKALFYLTNTYYKNNENKTAEESARQFLKRYPRSARLPSVLEILAIVIDRQGKLNEAIQEYRSWLTRYPKHQNRDQVSLFLADAYQKKGDLKRAVKIYTRIDSRFSQSNKKHTQRAALRLKLADTHFRLGNYKKSAALYDLILKRKTKGEKTEWAQFQLAMSYDRIGKKGQGTQIFTQLSEKSEDPLLKAFSSQKTMTGKRR
jgi:TolA-binding protein